MGQRRKIQIRPGGGVVLVALRGDFDLAMMEELAEYLQYLEVASGKPMELMIDTTKLREIPLSSVRALHRRLSRLSGRVRFSFTGTNAVRLAPEWYQGADRNGKVPGSIARAEVPGTPPMARAEF